MASVSIETLGAIAVITMIILTSDVTSAGFFFNISDVRNYAVFQVGEKRPNLRNQPKFLLGMKPK
jgi:hypothetical protein